MKYHITDLWGTELYKNTNGLIRWKVEVQTQTKAYFFCTDGELPTIIDVLKGME